MKRCFLVVIDSLGVGEAPDAKEYVNGKLDGMAMRVPVPNIYI